MKQKKNNLDEMQELKLLKIEHYSCWLAFWGLCAVILAQTALQDVNIPRTFGEFAVLGIMSIYMVAACIKNGIWDRSLQPTPKTNLLVSLLAGGILGVVWFVISYFRYHSFAGSVAIFAVMFLFAAVLCFLTLTVTAALYKKQKRRLENAPSEDE